MKIEDLKAKQQAASDEFDNLENQKNEINKRQFELRGEHSAYQKLIDGLPKDKATTIEAKPKKEVKNGK